MNIKVFYDSSDSYRVNVRAPLSLSASRIITWPDASGEVVLSDATSGMTLADGIDFTSSTNQLVTAGTSSVPLVRDTASTKFMQFYLDCGATSGTSVGLYIREYITGAGGSNACMRVYSDVSVAAATAQGIQCSLGFGESTTSGSVTGLGVAGRFQIGLADLAYPGTGTLAVVQSEIYSFGDASDPAGNNIAMFGVVNDGTTNGKADVDDDAVLFHFRGWGVGDANMIAVKAAGHVPNVTHSIRIKLPDNSLAYLYAGADPLTA